MTLGPALVALALTEPFFYVVHICVAHAAAGVVALIQSGELRRIKVITAFGSRPEWYGLALAGVFLVGALVVLALYLPCRWSARVKETRRE